MVFDTIWSLREVIVKKVVKYQLYLGEGKKQRRSRKEKEREAGRVEAMAGWCAVRGVCTGTSLGKDEADLSAGVEWMRIRGKRGWQYPDGAEVLLSPGSSLATKGRPVKPAPLKSRSAGTAGLA